MLPASFLTHLRERDEGYHPRSDKHSNALGEAIVADLMRVCATMRERAARGELVYKTNHNVITQMGIKWNSDLVLGSAPDPRPDRVSGDPSEGPSGIIRAAPSTVEVAIEIKGVMTEHGKAIDERARILATHYSHANTYNMRTVAGAVLVINGAPRFLSPTNQGHRDKEPRNTELLTDGRRVNLHPNPLERIEKCLAHLTGIQSRATPEAYGLDAKCAIVVTTDNLSAESVGYIEDPPAPGPSSPLHYDVFLRRLCDAYATRFS